MAAAFKMYFTEDLDFFINPLTAKNENLNV